MNVELVWYQVESRPLAIRFDVFSMLTQHCRIRESLIHVYVWDQCWQQRRGIMRIWYCVQFVFADTHTHLSALEPTQRFHRGLPSYEPCHVKTVPSIVLCCSGFSSDVTNILLGRCKQQFSQNWKTLGPFRRCCYLAAAFSSWPSTEDEPLSIYHLCHFG